MQNNSSSGKHILIVVGVLWLLTALAGVEGGTRSSAPAVTSSAWDGSVRQVEEYLERTLRDPDSLKVEDWGSLSETPTGYSVRVRYRAKNGFGGYCVADDTFLLDRTGSVTRRIPHAGS